MELLNAATVPRAEKIIIKANCAVGDAVGDCVVITGAAVGALYQVTRTDPTVDGAKGAFGIVLSKPSSTLCYVQTHGPLRDIYAGLTPNQPVYVGTDGRLTQVVPAPAVSGVLYVQKMGKALDAGVVLLNPEDPVKRYG